EVLPHECAGGDEQFIRIGDARRESVDDSVVKSGEREMQLGDDRIVVVSGITDERSTRDSPCRIAREIRRVETISDQELCSWLLAALESFVEVRLDERPTAVQAVEAQSWRPQVLDCVWIDAMIHARGAVERQVVLDELAEIRDAGGNRGVLIGRCRRLHLPGEILEKVLDPWLRTTIRAIRQEAFGPALQLGKHVTKVPGCCLHGGAVRGFLGSGNR